MKSSDQLLTLELKLSVLADFSGVFNQKTALKVLWTI
jgi:hypothetical protein